MVKPDQAWLIWLIGVPLPIVILLFLFLVCCILKVRSGLRPLKQAFSAERCEKYTRAALRPKPKGVRHELR